MKSSTFIGISFVVVSVAVSAPPQRRVLTSAAQIAFELEGQHAGYVIPVRVGGQLTRGPIAPAPSATPNQFGIAFGGGMSSRFYDWVAKSLDGRARAKNGALAVYDSQNKLANRRNLNNMLISEIGMPALDLLSKDPTVMTLKMNVTLGEESKTGAGAAAPGAPDVQKKWLPSNFRLNIDQMDTSKVKKVEAFVIKMSSTGPTSVEFPNLTFYMPEVDFVKTFSGKWNGPDFDANKNLRGSLAVMNAAGGRGFQLAFRSNGVHAHKVGDGSVRVATKMAAMNMQF